MNGSISRLLYRKEHKLHVLRLINKLIGSLAEANAAILFAGSRPLRGFESATQSRNVVSINVINGQKAKLHRPFIH
ncbi:hypothetical protein BpHYR1_037597 [Brachionus plicatilis]|uniref:Uncharacterized protein n=1 Tax=Brachionus plicatilis TaxID=10195 RepID=A0A3M7PI74_BRAPC|nr:hypothetical protein BpHYR1_037597 [Brachionus plicatilis]